MISLYQSATSGNDPDKVEMGLIEDDLRKLGIKLKRKEGVSNVGDGVGTVEDIRSAGLALRLFGLPKNDSDTGGGEKVASLFAGRWKRAGMASRASSLLMELSELRGSSGGDTDGNAPAA